MMNVFLLDHQVEIMARTVEQTLPCHGKNAPGSHRILFGDDWNVFDYCTVASDPAAPTTTVGTITREGSYVVLQYSLLFVP